jgi:hypothetical protein
VPLRRIVESDIFESVETTQERSSDIREDNLSLGTLLKEGTRGFNQFRTMQGEVTRSKLIMDPDAFAAEGGDPISSSRGYQSQYPTGSGTHRSVQFRSKKKSRLQPFREQGETSERASVGGQLTEPNNEVGGGDQSSLPKRSSHGSWSGASSPNQPGGAAFEPPS